MLEGGLLDVRFLNGFETTVQASDVVHAHRR